ncbi:pyridoxamine 5'-phosphate oxidase family protein [Paenarthrobacter sp. Z7-10]|uniref:pyridoxamine 5'-phosphate oxidase family protein n=1 Tax=Paenarthrobacter sp. Z7-10 TaxID=2787635 RepID=UPI0022A9B83E|nr:pyridoxamine 5'-phosphate oxidase family protein [Paenarthrobacter sp. Z7-10]MCZ2404901.1 pyridoxamine 5'-phosphate oxidase family protein [Paenarthrobacter sp. Z7-10]
MSADSAKVVEIINGTKIGMFTTVDESGALVSRPLAVQEVKDDGDLWFITDKDTSQVTQLARQGKVNVSFSSRSEWVSVSGTATVVQDMAKTKELWNQVVEAWFPDGPETPGVVLIHVESDSAEYWDSPGGTLATVISWVKSRVTGKRMEAGESHTTEL